ncbi:hypothetical protein RHSIM_Rhsim06G0064700 [Rhododendron simsii]|uniref:Growth-regulating factor n=1 Tax=Rhododendron simsii TaxID=118357 RepID=A0A834LM04_RHOSS|nr:hypothetical protein RHSIM_Rhsim06G0064700 [Rhododendron simsii]
MVQILSFVPVKMVKRLSTLEQRTGFRRLRHDEERDPGYIVYKGTSVHTYIYLYLYMDLGSVSLDSCVSIASSLASDGEANRKWYGTGILKQERSAEDSLRSIKVAKTEQMLSFSSPKSETVARPNYSHHSSNTYSRNTGYGFGGLNAESMQGVVAGLRSPFTPSQWMELEHQALIYKYITANVSIPSNLLIPIRRALESAGVYGFSSGALRSSTLGWGTYHLGYSNNNDPEPGRCRRTDGKKWRCSRDAVPDGKYCERHVNRGRHRSRKPVEGQNGHSVSGPTTTTTAKLMATSSPPFGLVVTGGGTKNSLGQSDHSQFKQLQPGAPNPCVSSPHLNSLFTVSLGEVPLVPYSFNLCTSLRPQRICLNKDNVGERNQDATNLSMSSHATAQEENQFSIPKQPNSYDEYSRAEFGLVYSDSLLNPLHKSKSQNSAHQFMDDRTHLSISIPETASDFMSSTSSPTNQKLAVSPLRLSREVDSEMGFRGSSGINQSNQRQVNWIPISWESSVGGPLGEVLHSSNSSPRLAPSSPTGVLQRMNNGFGSLSNSSAGSSPRAESHRIHDGLFTIRT